MGAELSTDQSVDKDEYFAEFSLNSLFADSLVASLSDSLPVYASTNDDVNDPKNMNFKHNRSAKTASERSKLEDLSNKPANFTNYQTNAFRKLKLFALGGNNSSVVSTDGNIKTSARVADYSLLSPSSNSENSDVATASSTLKDNLSSAEPDMDTLTSEVVELRRRRLLMRMYAAHQRLSESPRAASTNGNEEQEEFLAALPETASSSPANGREAAGDVLISMALNMCMGAVANDAKGISLGTFRAFVTSVLEALRQPSVSQIVENGAPQIFLSNISKIATIAKKALVEQSDSSSDASNYRSQALALLFGISVSTGSLEGLLDVIGYLEQEMRTQKAPLGLPASVEPFFARLREMVLPTSIYKMDAVGLDSVCTSFAAELTSKAPLDEDKLRAEAESVTFAGLNKTSDPSLGNRSPGRLVVEMLTQGNVYQSSAVATDGSHLYVWSDETASVHKVGTGFYGTICGQELRKNDSVRKQITALSADDTSAKAETSNAESLARPDLKSSDSEALAAGIVSLSVNPNPELLYYPTFVDKFCNDSDDVLKKLATTREGLGQPAKDEEASSASVHSANPCRVFTSNTTVNFYSRVLRAEEPSTSPRIRRGDTNPSEDRLASENEEEGSGSEEEEGGGDDQEDSVSSNDSEDEGGHDDDDDDDDDDHDGDEGEAEARSGSAHSPARSECGGGEEKSLCGSAACGTDESTSDDDSASKDDKLDPELDSRILYSGIPLVRDSMIAAIGQPIRYQNDGGQSLELKGQIAANYFEVKVSDLNGNLSQVGKRSGKPRLWFGFRGIEMCTDGTLIKYSSVFGEGESESAVFRLTSESLSKQLLDFSVDGDGAAKEDVTLGWGCDLSGKNIFFTVNGELVSFPAECENILTIPENGYDLVPIIRAELPRRKKAQQRFALQVDLNSGGAGPFKFQDARLIFSSDKSIVNRTDNQVTLGTISSQDDSSHMSDSETDKAESAGADADLKRMNDMAKRLYQTSLAYDAHSNQILMSSNVLLGANRLAILDCTTLSVLKLIDLPTTTFTVENEVDLVAAYPLLQNSEALTLPAPILVSGGDSTLLLRSRLVVRSDLPSVIVNKLGNVDIRNDSDSSDSSDNDLDTAEKLQPASTAVTRRGSALTRGCPLTFDDIEILSVTYKGESEADCISLDVDEYCKLLRSDVAGMTSDDGSLGPNRFQSGYSEVGRVSVTFALPYINLGPGGFYCRCSNGVKWNSRMYATSFSRGYTVEGTRGFYPFSDHLMFNAWREVMLAVSVMEVLQVQYAGDSATLKILNSLRLQETNSSFPTSSMKTDFDAAVANASTTSTLLQRPRLKHILHAYSNGVQLNMCVISNYHSQSAHQDKKALHAYESYKTQLQTYNLLSGKCISSDHKPDSAMDGFNKKISVVYDIQNNSMWGWNPQTLKVYGWRNKGFAPKLYRNVSGGCDQRENDPFSLNPGSRYVSLSENIVATLYCMVEKLAEPFIPSSAPLHPSLPSTAAELDITNSAGVLINLVSRPQTSKDDSGESLIAVRGQTLYCSETSTSKDADSKKSKNAWEEHEQGFHVAVLSPIAPHEPLAGVRHFPTRDANEDEAEEDNEADMSPEDANGSDDENSDNDSGSDSDNGSEDSDARQERREHARRERAAARESARSAGGAGGALPGNEASTSYVARKFPKVRIEGDGSAMRMYGNAMADYISACPAGAIVIITSHFNACSRHYSNHLVSALESIGVTPQHAETILRPNAHASRAKEHDSLCAKAVAVVGIKGSPAGHAKYVIYTHDGRAILNGCRLASYVGGKIILRMRIAHSPVPMCLNSGSKTLFKRLIQDCISRYERLKALSHCDDNALRKSAAEISVFISNIRILMANLNSLILGKPAEQRSKVISSRYSQKLKAFVAEMLDSPLFNSSEDSVESVRRSLYHTLSQCGLQIFKICLPLHYGSLLSRFDLLIHLLELYNKGNISPEKTQMLSEVLIQMRSSATQIANGSLGVPLTDFMGKLSECISMSITRRLECIMAGSTENNDDIITAGVTGIASSIVTSVFSKNCGIAISSADFIAKQEAVQNLLSLISIWGKECVHIAELGVAALASKDANRSLIESILEKSPVKVLLPGMLYAFCNAIQTNGDKKLETDAKETPDETSVPPAFKPGNVVEILSGAAGSESWISGEVVEVNGSSYSVLLDQTRAIEVVQSIEKIRKKGDSDQDHSASEDHADPLLSDLEKLNTQIQTLESCRSLILQMQGYFPDDYLVQTKGRKDTPTQSVKTLVIEGEHPYSSNMNETKVYNFPGAVKISLSFDQRCRTENGADHLTCYAAKDGNVLTGQKFFSCTGSATNGNWPGNGCPPFELPRGVTSFALVFHSDGSVEEWGYKLTVTSIVKTLKVQASVSYHWLVSVYSQLVQTLTLLFAKLVRGERVSKDLEERVAPLLRNSIVQEQLSMLHAGAIASGEFNDLASNLINCQDEPAVAKLVSHMGRFVQEARQNAHIKPISKAVYACVSALVKGEGLENDLLQVYRSCEAFVKSGKPCANPSPKLLAAWKTAQKIRTIFDIYIKDLESSAGSGVPSNATRDVETLSKNVVDSATFMLLTPIRGSELPPFYKNADVHSFSYDASKYDCSTMSSELNKNSALQALLRGPSSPTALKTSIEDASLSSTILGPPESATSIEKVERASPVLRRALSEGSGQSFQPEYAQAPKLVRSNSTGRAISTEDSNLAQFSPPRKKAGLSMYTASSTLAATVRLKNMVAYRKRQLMLQQQIRDVVEQNVVKRGDAIMQFLSDLPNLQKSVNAYGGGSTIKNLQAIHKVHSKRLKCRVLAIDLGVGILSDLLSKQFKPNDDSVFNTTHRAVFMQVIRSLSDELRSVHNISGSNEAPVANSDQADLHICAGTNGCGAPKNLQLRNMFGVLIKQIVSFATILYDRLDLAFKSSKIDGKVFDACTDDLMICVRSLSCDYTSQDCALLDFSGIADMLLPRVLYCSFDRNVCIAGEQLLNLLIRRCISPAVPALVGANPQVDHHVDLSRKLLRLLTKSLENLSEQSHALTAPFTARNLDDGLGLVLLQSTHVLRCDELESTGCSLPHADVGFRHSFSLWIKRSRSEGGLLEAASDRSTKGQAVKGGVIVLGSLVMRGFDEDWEKVELADSDGGLGNIGVVVRLEVMPKKGGKKGVTDVDPEDIIVVKWNKTTAARSFSRFLTRPVKYRRRHLNLACATVGGHIYSKGSTILASKAFDYEEKQVSPWSVFGLNMLPDASLSVFVSKAVVSNPSISKVKNPNAQVTDDGSSESSTFSDTYHNMRSSVCIPADVWTHVIVSQEGEKTSLYVQPVNDTSKIANTQSKSIESAIEQSFTKKGGGAEMKKLAMPATLDTFSIPASVTQSSGSSLRIIESPHNYLNSQEVYTDMVFADNVEALEITFDSRSITESGCDYVKFFKLGNRGETWHPDISYFHGGNNRDRNFPGVSVNMKNQDSNSEIDPFSEANINPPLIINSNSFTFHFRSDGSTNYWGYKIFVKPIKFQALGLENIYKTTAPINEHPIYLGQRPSHSGCNDPNIGSSVNALVADIRVYPTALEERECKDLTNIYLQNFNPAVESLKLFDLTSTTVMLCNFKMALERIVQSMPATHSSAEQTVLLPFNIAAVLSNLFKVLHTNVEWDSGSTIQSICMEIVGLLLPFSGVEVMQTLNGKPVEIFLSHLLAQVGRSMHQPKASAEESSPTHMSIDRLPLMKPRFKLISAILAAGKSKTLSSFAALVKRAILYGNEVLRGGAVLDDAKLQLLYGALAYFGGTISSVCKGDVAVFKPVSGIDEEVLILGETFVPTNHSRSWSGCFGLSESLSVKADIMDEYSEVWSGLSHYGEAVIVALVADIEHDIRVVPLRSLMQRKSQSAGLSENICRDLILAIGSDDLLNCFVSLITLKDNGYVGRSLQCSAMKSLHVLMSSNLCESSWLENALHGPLHKALLQTAFASSPLDSSANLVKSDDQDEVFEDFDGDWDHDVNGASLSKGAFQKTLNTTNPVSSVNRGKLAPVVFETDHPYANNTSFVKLVKIEGAAALVVVFDSESRTERGADYVAFYSDEGKNNKLNRDNFTGGYNSGGAGSNFPGTNEVAPFVVNGNQFYWHFYSDGSTTDWGVRATVYPAYRDDGKDVLDNFQEKVKNEAVRKRKLALYSKDSMITSGIMKPGGILNSRMSDVALLSVCCQHLQSFLLEGLQGTSSLASQNSAAESALDVSDGQLNPEYVMLDESFANLQLASEAKASSHLLSARQRALNPDEWFEEHTIRCAALQKFAKRKALERFECKNSNDAGKDFIPAFALVDGNGRLEGAAETKVNLCTGSRVINAVDVLRPNKEASLQSGDSIFSHVRSLLCSFFGVLSKQYALQCLNAAVLASDKLVRNPELILSLANSSINSPSGGGEETLNICREKLIQNLDAEIAGGNDKLLASVVHHASAVLDGTQHVNAEYCSADVFVNDPVVVETAHPPPAQHTQEWKVSIPGAAWLCIAFDARSHTRLPRLHQKAIEAALEKSKSLLPQANIPPPVFFEHYPSALKIGDIVRRGPDWSYNEQDTKNGTKCAGVVMQISSSIHVDWRTDVNRTDSSFHKNTYTYTPEGKKSKVGQSNSWKCHIFLVDPKNPDAKPENMGGLPIVATPKAAPVATIVAEQLVTAFSDADKEVAYDESNQGAYVTVKAESGVSDADAVRFCGCHWPLSPDAPSISEDEADNDCRKHRINILSNSYLRIDGDTAFIRFVSCDKRDPYWGFRCTVYGIKTPESELRGSAQVQKRLQPAQRFAQQRLACWTIDSLLAHCVSGPTSIRLEMTKRLFSPQVMGALRKIIASSFKDAIVGTESQKDASDSYDQMLRGELDESVRTSVSQTMSTMLRLLPIVQRNGGIDDAAAIYNELIALRSAMMSSVDKLRHQEMVKCFASGAENGADSAATKFIGRQVWAATRCAGISRLRWARGTLVKEVTVGELYEVLFEEIEPELLDIADETAAMKTPGAAVAVSKANAPTSPATALSPASNAAILPEKVEDLTEEQMLERAIQMSLADMVSASSAEIPAATSEPQVDVTPAPEVLLKEDESAKNAATELSDRYDSTRFESNDESDKKPAIRMSCRRTEFVFHADIYLWPSMQPLPLGSAGEETLIPYSVTPSSDGNVHRQCSEIGKISTPILRLMASRSQPSPYSSSPRLQQMLDVLSLVHSSVQSASQPVEVLSIQRNAGSDSEGGKAGGGIRNSDLKTSPQSPDVSGDIPPWLKCFSDTVTLMKAMRAHAIPECVLRAIYLPLTSAVMRKRESIAVGPGPGLAGFSFPGASSLLFLFNQPGLGFEWNALSRTVKISESKTFASEKSDSSKDELADDSIGAEYTCRKDIIFDFLSGHVPGVSSYVPGDESVASSASSEEYKAVLSAPVELTRDKALTLQPGTKLVFRRKSSYDYPEACIAGETVKYLQVASSGEPPIQVEWNSGHTYYVNPEDLTSVGTSVVPLPSRKYRVLKDANVRKEPKKDYSGDPVLRVLKPGEIVDVIPGTTVIHEYGNGQPSPAVRMQLADGCWVCISLGTEITLEEVAPEIPAPTVNFKAKHPKTKVSKQLDSDGWRVFESTKCISAFEIGASQLSLQSPATLFGMTELDCVIVPSYALPIALELSRSGHQDQDKSEEHAASVVRANILQRHLHNLDVVFGSHGFNLHKDQTRQTDLAFMQHIGTTWGKAISTLTLGAQAGGPSWSSIAPKEDDLTRSVQLKKLHDAQLDTSPIDMNVPGASKYTSWDVYHPLRALQELVRDASFDGSRHEPVVSTAGAKPDTASSGVSDPHPNLPSVSRSNCTCPAGFSMDRTVSVVFDYPPTTRIFCDTCKTTLRGSNGRDLNPLWHCSGSCKKHDYCDKCAESNFQIIQATSAPTQAVPSSGLKSNSVHCVYDDAILQALFGGSVTAARVSKSCMCPNGCVMTRYDGEIPGYNIDGEYFGYNCDTCKVVCAESPTSAEPVWHCDCGVDYCKKCALGVQGGTEYDIGSPTPIRARFQLIRALNAHVADSLSCFDIARAGIAEKATSSARLLGQCRELLYPDLIAPLWECVINQTASSQSSGIGNLCVSRPLASRHAGTPDKYGRYSVFSQAFRRMHGLNPIGLRNGNKLYNLALMGEYSQDAGGPYRESFDIYMAELQSASMSLMVKTPNGTQSIGFNRDRWVFNPDATSHVELEMLSFFGKLLGIAVRSKGYLNLSLPSMMWKLICGEQPTVDDLEGINYNVVHNVLHNLRHIDQGEHAIDAEAFGSIFFDTFTTISTSGREVELIPGGKDVDLTFYNREQYCDLVENYRLHEFDAQVAAVRRGLATIVPLSMLNVLPWNVFERMVCGDPEVDLDLLQSCTNYEGCSGSDAHIKNFWEILREFNTEERRALLKFVWGRSRLPLTRESFTDKFKITSFNRTPVDQFFPVSHTCFFSLELPRYSTKQIMKDKLVYAIFNCLAIDADNTGEGQNNANMAGAWGDGD